MADLTPEQLAQGIFLDANGIPTNPDGTPLPGWERGGFDLAPPPVGDPSASLVAQIAWQAGLTGADGSSGGRGGGPEQEPPADLQVIGGVPFEQDPLSYGFGPYYSPSPIKYEDTNRPPPLDPEWYWGKGLEENKPDAWREFYTPNDRSTGGGFFLAKDAFGGQAQPEWMGNVPAPFQQGSTRPSTNNWRLLGPNSSPRYIMRNGYIIDLQATDLRGPPVPDIGFGNNYGGPNWNMGAGAGVGFPAAYNRGYSNSAGWPGNNEWANAGSYWIG